MGGRPIPVWLQRFLLCHHRERDGWRRLAWPDGGSLLAQSWPEVLTFQMLGAELDAVAHERRTRTVPGR